jgi:hypothetical protein
MSRADAHSWFQGKRVPLYIVVGGSLAGELLPALKYANLRELVLTYFHLTYKFEGCVSWKTNWSSGMRTIVGVCQTLVESLAETMYNLKRGGFIFTMYIEPTCTGAGKWD